MENNLNIEIIESGRLTKGQSIKPEKKFFCEPSYLVQCASYTNCTKFGDEYKEGRFVSQCTTGESYSKCSWIVPYSPYGG